MSYKLNYFDIDGRGESIRMIFALANVKFVDNRIAKEQWAQIKPTSRWGYLPTLEVDGKEIGQSLTINRFLGRKFRLAGADDWEAARCDEIADAVSDLANEWVKYYFTSDPEKKEEGKQAFLNTHVPKYLGKLNNLQKENGGVFMVGKNVTWVDVFLAEKLVTFQNTVDSSVLDQYPNLKRLKEAVYDIPQIKEYVNNRPK